MRRKRHFVRWIAVLTAALFAAAGGAAADTRAVDFDGGGRVLMIRHARAPGSGDPAHVTVGDCATQRNLDDAGRAQAREIGAWLRGRGVSHARVFSSQWCRCLDTAALLDLGPVTELPALNSFYERPHDREPNLRRLRAFLAGLPVDGPLVILVTHYVTIAGLTGEHMPSGGGVLLQLAGEGAYEVVAQLSFSPR